MSRYTRGRLAAKRVLTNSVPRVSRDVIVVSKDRSGDLYVASSMPSRCTQEMDAQIKLVELALKDLRRRRRLQERDEKRTLDEAMAA